MLCVFVFQGSLLMIVIIMIDGSEKSNNFCEGGF